MSRDQIPHPDANPTITQQSDGWFVEPGTAPSPAANGRPMAPGGGFGSTQVLNHPDFTNQYPVAPNDPSNIDAWRFEPGVYLNIPSPAQPRIHRPTNYSNAPVHYQGNPSGTWVTNNVVPVQPTYYPAQPIAYPPKPSSKYLDALRSTNPPSSSLQRIAPNRPEFEFANPTSAQLQPQAPSLNGPTRKRHRPGTPEQPNASDIMSQANPTTRTPHRPASLQHAGAKASVEELVGKITLYPLLGVSHGLFKANSHIRHAATQETVRPRAPEGPSSLGGTNARPPHADPNAGADADDEGEGGPQPRDEDIDMGAGVGAGAGAGGEVREGAGEGVREGVACDAGAIGYAEEDGDKDHLELMRNLYEGAPDAHWASLYKLIDRVISKQDALSFDVRKLDDRTKIPRTQTKPSQKDQGGHTSPPEPPQDPTWNQSVPCTLPAGRRSRAQRHRLLLHLQGLIRETIFKLLGRKSVRDPLPPPPPVFVRAPTLVNFCIRWDENEKSVFNRIAASLIVQRLSGEQPAILTVDETKKLPGMNQVREDAEDFRAGRLQRCSADSRKRTLYETRLRVIDRFPLALGKHRQLFVHLGVAGTSSDEEDSEHPGVYKVKRRIELSSRVAQLKELCYKGPGSKGSQLHRRGPSDLVSDRPFLIEGLPVTCMSRAWMNTLSAAEKEFYRFQPHKYDYSFPTEIFKHGQEGGGQARAASVDLDM
ncbi:hypothetical protein BDV93DRAFT_515987 [Ceratobasidium sp. AG-I]|nr:hypothetical protein BDV93DRAFT_515987 [Ceratobasidium sp. AG-I]